MEKGWGKVLGGLVKGGVVILYNRNFVWLVLEMSRTVHHHSLTTSNLIK